MQENSRKGQEGISCCADRQPVFELNVRSQRQKPSRVLLGSSDLQRRIRVRTTNQCAAERSEGDRSAKFGKFGGCVETVDDVPLQTFEGGTSQLSVIPCSIEPQARGGVACTVQRTSAGYNGCAEETRYERTWRASEEGESKVEYAVDSGRIGCASWLRTGNASRQLPTSTCTGGDCSNWCGRRKRGGNWCTTQGGCWMQRPRKKNSVIPRYQVKSVPIRLLTIREHLLTFSKRDSDFAYLFREHFCDSPQPSSDYFALVDLALPTSS
ncbi:hypothetical protein G7K_2562-t1 [Saitoella complicata NRRL Y-17804]|uniref:Uncharacterized protein n=1 Tax=Saitoella complicata (strain BCRC 22490 / CBS 7301 / JCM 7358 / NBRC 10748 / NRRL Y-17804) TaxID=698492 RepID=A0A0E9NEX8_SAICN|nr:hypothetical protein G7K_2562-t1 [Saitoella complicata NRRL Y-17804]